MARTPKSACIIYRSDNRKAVAWARKIEGLALQKGVRLEGKKPDALIVLGGDGAILEAARSFVKTGPVIFGLNLGTVGFLASVRNEKKFLKSAENFFEGRYALINRMMLDVAVRRGGIIVSRGSALNEVVIQNPLSMVTLDVEVGGFPLQQVRGSGVLVATSTGSTAYNLSAHGPIVMPEINCLILTELLDHNIPTPSVVITPNRPVRLRVGDFRSQGNLLIAQSNKPADVLLLSDGEVICSLEKGDEVVVSKSAKSARFAEMEDNYFLKSLHEQFSYK